VRTFRVIYHAEERKVGVCLMRERQLGSNSFGGVRQRDFFGQAAIQQYDELIRSHGFDVIVYLSGLGQAHGCAWGSTIKGCTLMRPWITTRKISCKECSSCKVIQVNTTVNP
jgi:hypothetical protein